MRVWSLLLAIVLPTLLLSGGLAALESVRTADDLTQEGNVGVVLNGRHTKRPLLDAIDAYLDRTQPEIVVMGNSIANTDFALEAFARATGVPSKSIARISVPNTMAAHWYAILKNRVYARGHEPRMIIFVSDLQSLLAVVPRSEASHVALTLQLGPEEPLIDGKLGTRLWAVERIRENRTVARDRMMTWLRNRIVDLLVHGSLTPLDSGPTDLALSRVFAEERLNSQLHKRVIPIFNVTAPFAVTFTEDELAPVDQGFATDIMQLVSDHGGTVVFVRPPMSPRLPKDYGDIVPEALEASLSDAFTARGHHYVDLRGIPMAASHFQNLDHLNEEGSRRFTWLMADVMRQIGADPRPPLKGVDLLSTVVLENGVLRERDPEITFGKRVPSVPGGLQEINNGVGKSAFFSAGAFSWLADVNTLAASPHGARCSPLRVVEETLSASGEASRQVLGPANVMCDELMKLGAGRTCHSPERVIFSASDNTDPWDNGRNYSLILDPDRSCPESRWSYPKDVFTIVVPPTDEPVDELELQAAELGSTGRGGAPEVRITILRGSVPVHEQAVPLADVVKGARVRFPSIDADGLSVRIDNPSDRFLLWQHLRVRPR